MDMPSYDTWLNDPTPENMAKVIDELDPTITSEIHRYSGPSTVLRGQAKLLAVSAIKSYKPDKGAHLRSWVVTRLQPLSRYSSALRPVYTAEISTRRAAELNRIRGELNESMGREPTKVELADHMGISVSQISRLQQKAKPIVYEGALSQVSDANAGLSALPGTIASDIVGQAEDIVYNSLSGRDKQIYDLKTGRHGKTAIPNHLIAKRFGVTPAAISYRSAHIARQIQSIAERRM